MTDWRDRRNAPQPGQSLCAATDVPEGAGRGFEFGAGRDAFRMFVARLGGEYRAYLNLCPHFAAPLNASPGRFFNSRGSLLMCSQHYALFRFEDGFCVDGPCKGDALTAIPVRVEGGTIVVG